MATGYRLLHEEQTLIVPLMRGGESMAFGINDAFPLAMFLHAKNPTDIMSDHLRGRCNLILVDSVINTGKSVIEFVEHIHSLDAKMPIVVVAGVVQCDSIARMNKELTGHIKPTIIALRDSENQYTGKGATDTGHRLFNSTHLP
jgi:uracil phosphoribosyltransferase